MTSSNNNKAWLVVVIAAPLLFFAGYFVKGYSAEKDVEKAVSTAYEVGKSCADVRFYGKQIDLGLDMAVLRRIQDGVDQESWNEIYPNLLERLSKKIGMAEKEVESITDPMHRKLIERKIHDAKSLLEGAS